MNTQTMGKARRAYTLYVRERDGWRAAYTCHDRDWTIKLAARVSRADGRAVAVISRAGNAVAAFPAVSDAA